MAALPTLSRIRKKRQHVLMRIDADVDIKNSRILDDTRLVSSLQSLAYLRKLRSQISLVGHIGRPEGRNLKYTLEPIAHWFGHVLKESVQKDSSDGFGGWQIGKQIRLYENIRFFSEEEKNSSQFAHELSQNHDLFVNEAFAVAHRAHASTVGITKYIPSVAGLHFEREIKELDAVLSRPKRPFVVVIGGAKIETKLPMVEAMHTIADFVLVGGEVASHTKELITVQHKKLAQKRSVVLVADLTQTGLDITPQSAENFAQIIATAKTVIWNGPVGQTGHSPITEEGTRVVSSAVVNSHAYTIVGGGDTLSYLKQHKLLDKCSFVSVGGGAMLEYLSGVDLPAVEALKIAR